MDKPYRWGDVTPPAVQVIKKRRQYRASSLYEIVKRGRRRDAEARHSLRTPREYGPDRSEAVV